MSSSTRSGARLHTESVLRRAEPGFMKTGKMHPVDEFWAAVNEKINAELKCACGKTALFRVLQKGSSIPKGYCRKHKPGQIPAAAGANQ